jgi:hypothetical protein
VGMKCLSDKMKEITMKKKNKWNWNKEMSTSRGSTLREILLDTWITLYLLRLQCLSQITKTVMKCSNRNAIVGRFLPRSIGRMLYKIPYAQCWHIRNYHNTRKTEMTKHQNPSRIFLHLSQWWAPVASRSAHNRYVGQIQLEYK